MSELEALLIGMVLLLCLMGGCLAFIVWRVCLWVKQIAGALGELARLVHEDMERRGRGQP